MPFENSSQRPNQQWPAPEGWLQNVLDIAGQVAQVVGPLVPVVLGMLTEKSGGPQPFRTTGPINWYFQNDVGQPEIWVENTDSNEVSLAFTGWDQQTGESEAHLVNLGPASPTAPDAARQPVTGIIRRFMSEEMPNPYVAMVTANRDRTGVSLLNTRLISVMLADLMVSWKPLKIPGGMTVDLRRNPTTGGYELVVSGGVALLNLQYTVVIHGQAISGTTATTGREAGQELVIPIPTAFSFQVADSVRLYYEIPVTAYEQEGRRTRSQRSVTALASA